MVVFTSTRLGLLRVVVGFFFIDLGQVAYHESARIAHAPLAGQPNVVVAQGNGGGNGDLELEQPGRKSAHDRLGLLGLGVDHGNGRRNEVGFDPGVAEDEFLGFVEVAAGDGDLEGSANLTAGWKDGIELGAGQAAGVALGVGSLAEQSGEAQDGKGKRGAPRLARSRHGWSLPGGGSIPGWSTIFGRSYWRSWRKPIGGAGDVGNNPPNVKILTVTKGEVKNLLDEPFHFAPGSF